MKTPVSDRKQVELANSLLGWDSIKSLVEFIVTIQFA